MYSGEAVIVKNTGSHYLLDSLDGEWKPFPAILRGKVRMKRSSSTNPVAVGDRVLFESSREPSEQHPAAITKVLERRNYIIRKSTNLSRQSHIIAANLDRACIVVSLMFPELKLPFLDRLLVTCEVYNVPPVIILNKVDMYRESVQENIDTFRSVYESAGYSVLETSAVTGEGMDSLRTLCKGGVSLFSGESGVGKSSLLKAMDPSVSPRVGEISQAHLRGRHTTTFYEMYRLSFGAYVVDTPGLRGFGLVDVAPEEVALYFPEMLHLAGECRFTPCTHTHEPGCAVKAAVDEGKICAERYNSYLGMLEEDKKFR